MIDGINSSLSRTGPVEGGTGSRAVAARGTGSAEPVESRLAVSVSARARLGAQVVAAAHASDGVDASLVDRLGASMQAGTFTVSPEAIAAALLGGAKGRGR